MNELLLRRRVAASKSLPYNAEIEYLGRDNNNRSAYIDTGIKISSNVTFEIALNVNTTASNGGIFGGRSAANLNQIAIFIAGKQTFTWRYGNQSNGFSRINGDYVFSNVLARNVLVANDISITSSYTGTFSTNYIFYLFGYNNAGSLATITGTILIKYAKIYESGVLVRDFIPVRVSTTGYMYDKVSKQLFGNAGTGSFILGPDK